MQAPIAALVLAASSGAFASADEPDAFHGGVSVGLGTAYDGLGLRFEGGSNHLGLFGGLGFLPAAIGSITTNSSGPYGFSAGARWYRGIRDGLFVSFNLSYAWWREFSNYDLRSATSATNPGHLFTVSAVAGYRWRSAGGVFFELGAGGGWFRHLESFSCAAYTNEDCLAPTPNAPTSGLFPDVALGVGWDL